VNKAKLGTDRTKREDTCRPHKAGSVWGLKRKRVRKEGKTRGRKKLQGYIPLPQIVSPA